MQRLAETRGTVIGLDRPVGAGDDTGRDRGGAARAGLVAEGHDPRARRDRGRVAEGSGGEPCYGADLEDRDIGGDVHADDARRVGLAGRRDRDGDGGRVPDHVIVGEDEPGAGIDHEARSRGGLVVVGQRSRHVDDARLDPGADDRIRQRSRRGVRVTCGGFGGQLRRGTGRERPQQRDAADAERDTKHGHQQRDKLAAARARLKRRHTMIFPAPLSAHTCHDQVKCRPVTR